MSGEQEAGPDAQHEAERDVEPDAEQDADAVQDVVPGVATERDETAEAEGAHAAAERKRKLDEVFGSGEHHGGGKGDAWYRDQIPPHHG